MPAQQIGNNVEKYWNESSIYSILCMDHSNAEYREIFNNADNTSSPHISLKVQFYYPRIVNRGNPLEREAYAIVSKDIE